jgi:hypothetical protein
MATKSAGEQDGKQCPITFPFKPFPVGCLPERVRLFGGQPVAEPYAQFLYASDPSYSAKSALISPQSAAS